MLAECFHRTVTSNLPEIKRPVLGEENLQNTSDISSNNRLTFAMV